MALRAMHSLHVKLLCNTSHFFAFSYPLSLFTSLGALSWRDCLATGVSSVLAKTVRTESKTFSSHEDEASSTTASTQDPNNLALMERTRHTCSQAERNNTTRMPVPNPTPSPTTSSTWKTLRMRSSALEPTVSRATAAATTLVSPSRTSACKALCQTSALPSNNLHSTLLYTMKKFKQLSTNLTSTVKIKVTSARQKPSSSSPLTLRIVPSAFNTSESLPLVSRRWAESKVNLELTSQRSYSIKGKKILLIQKRLHHWETSSTCYLCPCLISFARASCLQVSKLLSTKFTCLRLLQVLMCSNVQPLINHRTDWTFTQSKLLSWQTSNKTR